MLLLQVQMKSGTAHEETMPPGSEGRDDLLLDWGGSGSGGAEQNS